MIKQRSISFYTLGCRLNQSETAVLQQSFKFKGYQVVGFDHPADIVVINTCTVTENGDADTRRLVHKISRLNPQSRIALIGCQSQVQKKKLTALPNVRWVVGNARKMELADIVHDDGPNKAEVIAPAIPRDPFTIPVPGVDASHTRANIKIQDGCDFFCSFCEIPYARGRARSRVFTDIEREAVQLVDAGHQELVLTGINIGTYRYKHYRFLDVISMLEQITDLKRIRISSIEPTTVPDGLIKKMAQKGKVCRHLHIPLQSGNDRVLKDMKRKYTRSDFFDFIAQVEARVPRVCIGTDIIVGFPTESRSQFEETFDCLKDSPVDYVHVFSYSQRNLAQSRRIREKTPAQTIQARSRKLRELSSRKRRLFHESMIGTTHNVLFEQLKNGYWSGLTDNYIRIHVKIDLDLENQFRKVKACAVDAKGVRGEIQN